MTILVIQCRLESKRLSRKALLPLGRKELIAWTMDAMRCVPADKYILATDEDSFPELSIIAKKKGWDCFAGPKNDVLERFCQVIKKHKADTLIRATGDNPFLFYEVARSSIEVFPSKKCDYFTYTGLPHGCGVEVFNTKALLDAAEKTDNPFDREHVGPAVFQYPEEYVIVKEPVAAEWNYPDLRTTIDTVEDYEFARRLVHIVSGTKKVQRPYTSSETLHAMQNLAVYKNILLCPSVKKGCGTGHLRRCIKMAAKNASFLYIPNNVGLTQCEALLEEAKKTGELAEWQIVHALNDRKYAFIVLDMFSTDKQKASVFWKFAPVIAIDEGSLNTMYFDYILDIIPSSSLERNTNLSNPAFIDLPLKRKKKAVKVIHKVIITLGGEDPIGLTSLAENVFKEVRAVDGSQLDITVVRKPIPNLAEKLAKYDLVVTHYGLTAFEAAAANCAVILLGTSSLHIQLAKKFGFACVMTSALHSSTISEMIKHPNRLGCGVELKKALNVERMSLNDFIASLANCRRRGCPICDPRSNKPEPDMVVFRDEAKTIRRCGSCGLLYISFNAKAAVNYTENYFFEEYKNQYGKTYLEDFNYIKTLGIRRIVLIDSLYWKKHKRHARHSESPVILDIGCAYGPFLSAAADTGWIPYGTDISKDAVDYVNNELGYPAVQSFFPVFNPAEKFGRSRFDAVSMWYVIEHFENLDTVLSKVACLIKPNGVFAFSTPSGSGVSATYNREEFFSNNPSDHYSIFEPKKIQSIMKRYGFKVQKILYTGHHAERFPNYTKDKEKKIMLKSKMMNLGDTFEVYCIKIPKSGDV
ncbi:MAG TPA: methyltransferase domain-containing protein [Treponemataceae bacterium]|nr:methyltransferase domain-containing protein [Treponemataceae bacterium]